MKWFDLYTRRSRGPPDKRATSGTSKSRIKQYIRSTEEYREWREAVLERDDYTCQSCGTERGEMHAHHIVRMADDVSLALKVDNGVTLCKRCHRRRH